VTSRTGLILPWLGHLLLAAAIAAAITPARAQDADKQACADGAVPVGGDCVQPSELAGKIRSTISDFMKEDDLTAVIVNVRVGDTQILREAFGTSMTGVPATPEMHFRNGAVAIAYLSAVLLRLQEDGLLSIDDKLSKWFPDYPKADQVTLHMLMTSTSGYADYVNLDILPLYEDPFRAYTPDELIKMGLSQPMVCEPGSCFAYAHTNFVILGEVLSKVAGKPVAELIRDFVLTPLALDNTRSEQTAVIQAPVLHAFTAERGIFEDSTYWDPSWTLARGAVMTTDIDDLVTSAIAIGDGTLLSPQSHQLQVAPSTAGMPPFNDTVYYAMGILLTNGWVIQTPSFAGYAAAMAYLPSQKIAIGIAATNGRNTPDSPRPTDVLFLRIGEMLAPDQTPKMAR
jgi:D-alanyl-D-alanine carboxypeptidase